MIFTYVGITCMKNGKLQLHTKPFVWFQKKKKFQKKHFFTKPLAVEIKKFVWQMVSTNSNNASAYQSYGKCQCKWIFVDILLM